MKKYIIKLIVICAALLSYGMSLAAQDGNGSPVLTLEDCRMMALDSSRTLVGTRLMEEKTKADRNAMLTNFFPKISGYGYYLYSSSDLDLKFASKTISPFKYLPDITIPGFTLPFSIANSYSVGVTAVQPIFMGGKIATGYKMTKMGNRMAALNTSLERSSVILGVDEAYWTYVKTCKLYDAALNFENTVNEVYKVVQDAVDVGMASENDLLKVKVQRNNANLMISKARNGMKLSKMALCHSIGLNLFADINVDTTDFNVEEAILLEPVSVENRYDYKLLDMKSQLARENVKIVRSDYLPQLGLMLGYGYTDALTFKGIKFDNGREWDLNDRLLQGDNFSLMVRLNIPICAWGQGHFKIKSAKKEAEMADNEKQILQEKMELEQTMYRLNTEDARLNVEFCKSALEEATANLKSAKDYYEVGMGTLAVLLEAQTQWSKASSDYIEAIGEYKLEYTRFLKSCGMLEPVSGKD